MPPHEHPPRVVPVSPLVALHAPHRLAGGRGDDIDKRHGVIAARDMARFGLLFLNQGNWASGHNNKCFVIPEWDMVVVRLGLDGTTKDEAWDWFLANSSGQREMFRAVWRLMGD